jgi:hypothetical protein
MLKNITLSAEEVLIQKARKKAQEEHTTLNEVFRLWLKKYVYHDSILEVFDHFMEKVDYADAGGKFSRDEMNER